MVTINNFVIDNSFEFFSNINFNDYKFNNKESLNKNIPDLSKYKDDISIICDYYNLLKYVCQHKSFDKYRLFLHIKNKIYRSYLR